MNFTNETLYGVGIGATLIAAVFVWSRLSNHQRSSITIAKHDNSRVRRTPIKENIRQIALIEKDEFDAFYTPVIEKVERYEAQLGSEKIDRSYFEIIYKALRKRRASIFEFGSSERDQQTKALWTFALFCTLSLRHIVRRFSAHEFTLKGKPINPFLLNLKELSLCQRQLANTQTQFKPDHLNIHLIDKVLPSSMIARLSDTGIYPYILNGTSGFYQQRINPFYSIVEQVEGHVSGQVLTPTEVFKQNIKIVLLHIQNNTFTKNTPESFVFEGMSYLLLDRNFLWELYRAYAISDAAPLGKREFETLLAEVFELGNQLEKATEYRITLEEKIIDNHPEKMIVVLRNMVALTYKAVPYYQYSDRRRIKKNALQRDVTIGDIDRGTVEEHSIVQSVVEKKSRHKANFPEGQPDPVALKDLFSDQQ